MCIKILYFMSKLNKSVKGLTGQLCHCPGRGEGQWPLSVTPGPGTIPLPRARPGASHTRRWDPWRRPLAGSDKRPPHSYHRGASHLQIWKLLAAVARCDLVQSFKCILNLTRKQVYSLFNTSFKYWVLLIKGTNAFQSILSDRRHRLCRLASLWWQGQLCLEARLKFYILKETQQILSSTFHLSKPVQFSKGINFQPQFLNIYEILNKNLIFSSTAVFEVSARNCA